MGSKSDWPTMEQAALVLEEFGVPFESKIVSAHRTPDLLFDFAKSAESRGIEVIIAGAGGAVHLPGMLASVTALPVIGVPVALAKLDGMDSLLSIVQMPAGIPVATVDEVLKNALVSDLTPIEWDENADLQAAVANTGDEDDVGGVLTH